VPVFRQHPEREYNSQRSTQASEEQVAGKQSQRAEEVAKVFSKGLKDGLLFLVVAGTNLSNTGVDEYVYQ